MADFEEQARGQAAAEYRARLNRVEDYIERHLGEELSLDELAGVANFSRFHFHRVFALMTGETLFACIQRLRLEKAATQLALDPTKRITDVCYDCGFASPQAFAKSFRKRYGMSAGEWRQRRRVGADRCTAPEESKQGQAHGKQGKAAAPPPAHIEYRQNTIIWRYEMETKTHTVEVVAMEAATLAYVRHVGPYEGDGALFERLWNRLMTWAGPRALVVPGSTRFITVYHDSPDITDKDKLRISVGITVPPDTPVDGEIGLMPLEGGTYGVGHFELGEKDYGEAWSFLYGTWLPESGYVPDDRPAFEEYPMDAEAQHESDPAAKRPVNIWIPVRPI